MTASAPGAGFLAAATYNPPDGAGLIINILAWCVTAAGVFGVMVVGINMAIQLNRGEPGEGGAHFRGAFFILLACVVATSARPLVEFLGDLSLLGP
ncbi:hypothetical protein LXH13_12260 [Streptomyces spinosirectus]|jgi:hypothetical protein|uniref:hypothetical protein n=1 Tax=Streptomyces TaxID=1883 RepID=UPI000D47E047|nr:MULTISPECIES: hypothetical protein [Streptomyces]MBY8345518.1 hypothetical protein [Streptomyces plumbidurans]PTM99544.1 hypothetical protein C7821_102492 [Streptomyces sp. VMFN-G11Ma]UIR17764.1 hypothetical protein LXH13_12260 [Streptomyces spinosirectus]